MYNPRWRASEEVAPNHAVEDFPRLNEMNVNRDWLGAPPEEVAKSLRDFDQSSDLLSNDRQLVDKYAQKWVGVCSGEVKAAEDDLDSLLRALDSRGVSRSNTVVRFIEREQRTLIL